MNEGDVEGLIAGIKKKRFIYPLAEKTEKEMTDYLRGVSPALAVTELPYKTFRISQYPDEGCDATILQDLSFRRLILNRAVGLIKPGLGQNIADVVMGLLGFYDSDFFIRDLLGDKKMVELLHSYPESCSLLGKLKTNDFSTGRERTRTVPFLVIPCNDKVAREWESRYQSDRLAEMVLGVEFD